MVDDQTKSRFKQKLVWILAGLLIISALGVVYFAATPQERTGPYTEFYILDTEREASEYPTKLSSGEAGELIVGIGNHEHEDMTYTVVFAIDEAVLEERTVTVENGETWEGEMSFSIDEPGRYELDILLFKGDELESLDDPYRDLQLEVTVEEE